MVKWPTGSDGEPSSPNYGASAGVKARQPFTFKIAYFVHLILRNKNHLHRIVINGRRGLFFSLAACLIIVGIGGAGFWFLEPTAHHDFGQSVWLAFTTAATVGYGDIVPSTTASRIFSVIVVLMGVAVISLVTASLSALFVYIPDDGVELNRAVLKELFELRTEIAKLQQSIQNSSMLTQHAPPSFTDETSPHQIEANTDASEK